VLNVRKEAGWTSHDVVARIRGKLRGLKVGHAGTLDPSATGVLPLLVGRGTRIAEFLLEWNKTYLAGLRLGETTDTQDATGVVLKRSPIDLVTEEHVRKAAAGFQGCFQQMPPMYSAIKVGGVPLYRSARAGRDIERQARKVTVFSLDIVGIRLPDVVLRVACSKGTYIRTLCADIGDKLGVGGHLSTLVRERVGPLMVEHALSVDKVESRLKDGTLGASMLTLDEALVDLPACRVGAGTARRVSHGMSVFPSEVLAWEAWPNTISDRLSRAIRIKDESGLLLAIGVLPMGGADVETYGLGDSPIAVSKVLVSEKSQEGGIEKSEEE
jgi:tRNA pseudouridine55 synthase